MHPQYLPQQYGGLAGLGQGGPPGASRPSPSVTPGSYQQPAPTQGSPLVQRMGPGSGGFPQSDGRDMRSLGPQSIGIPNGPSLPPTGPQGGFPQHSRDLQNMSPHGDLSMSNHLVGQMSGMNINGPPRSSQSLDYPGNTTAKQTHTVRSYGDIQPAVNGVMSLSNEQSLNGLSNQTPPWPSRGSLPSSSQPSTPSGDTSSNVPEQFDSTPIMTKGQPNQVKALSQQMGGPPQQMGGPPQQMGGPPQQMGGPPQQMGGPPQQMGGPPQQMGAPPQQMGAPPQQMGAPPQQMGDPPQQTGGPPQQMGGPPQQMGGPPQQMGGPPQQMGGPPQQMGGPPQQMGGPQQQMGGPPQRGPQQMGGPPHQIGGPTQQMGGPTQQMGGPPQQMGGPPQQMGGPTQQMGGPPQQMGGPPQQIGGPPQQMGGPPQHMRAPPHKMGDTPQQMGSPPQQMGSQPHQMGGPPQQMGGPPQQMGGPPQLMRGPPQQMGTPPQQMGIPPQQMGGPTQMRDPHQQMGGPPQQMGGPPQQMGGPPPQMGGPPPQMGGPPQQMGGPPQHMGGPPQQMRGPPQHMGGTSQHMGGSPYQMGGHPQQMGGSPHQMGGHPQQMGGPPHQMGGPPPQMGGSPYQMGSPPGMTGPPHMGLPPLTNQQQQMGNTQFHQTGPAGGKGYPPPNQDAYNTSMGGQPYQAMGAGGYPAGPQQPAQPARRLDPDQMPSPIQVMQDDQRNRSGVFCTNQKGLVPPLVTTDFSVQDGGNASPRYIRSTMYSVPATVDMMKQTGVPFGLVIAPMAEEESHPPIVDLGELGPVRCNRCKAYMCPFMQFIDGGRRFHCLFCKAATEVPSEYFQHLDHTGQRVDRYERPELVLGTYEFVATKDYCKNNTFPQPPAVVFLIDVSYNNIKSGLVQLLCSRMKEIIRLLPREVGAERSNMRVGFITYNNTVHFYNVKGVLAQPQMMVVGDLQDMFMPLLEGFLCDPLESEAVIDSLMQQIPLMFADTRETETILAPAIQAGLEALKASECSGKLLVFHSSLPIAEAPGKLKNRDDRKLLGTEKEKTVLAPQVNTYNHLGQECVGTGCSVDLFVFNNSYVDLATIGQVCRLTGGEVYKYTYFQADLDGERFIEDLSNNISRPVAFDAIMRVRTSTGVRATDFYGHLYMQNTTDMELCSIDCNKAVAIEVKHDDKLTEEDGVYVQVALLYTSCSGQRRLRIINLSLKTCVQMADLYRSCDLDTIINFFAKQAIPRLLESPPKMVKDSLVNRCANMLACYRKNCASPSSAGQLILPECMKLLPLYINCILKSDAISGGSDMTIDDRWFVMQALSIMDIPSSVAYFYPRLLPLLDVDPGSDEIPSPIRCSSDKLTDDGVYLLENGIHMFIWIGLNVDVEWVQNVFGVHSAAQIDIDKTELPILDNPLSEHIRNMVQKIRDQRHRSMRLTLVRQRDKLELVFKHFLMEDRGLDGSPSYVDFLCHMHKEIRGLLS
ncbi:protein transport protein Sec24C [Bacillus rossius redtenbacheri]|uniref:protein transport protein Sec24C n=1 Tax=Bacillus rossius redtenbacheri TaxID=93214 RepID=UPI002FDD60EA